ncbi:MAG: SAM-dependent methyltransferase [Flavobacterium sp. BFFFF2]|nr:MAG: SAM-dependent methyltransferase [Flavobacterium sp. BFFFF2]
MLLKYRSTEKEYLDGNQIETKDLYQNLIELDVINSRLGGYHATRKGLAAILKTETPVRTVLDIGFGGGDAIKQMQKYAEQHGLNLFFYGVDLKDDCVQYAKKNLAAYNNTQLICDDYRNISAELLQQIDVIHCSLFLHHLTDEEIVDLLKFGKSNHCIILANDLQRHWFAYYSIRWLTTLFSKSYLVRNDAPISVKRGFKRNELISLLEKAGYTNYSVTWSWAFRYILIATE